MHILTGMIITALLRRRKKSGAAASDLPRFKTGPIRVAHSLPGRVRFQVPSLVGNAEGKKLVAEKLTGLDGVQQVAISNISGSVVIRFDEHSIRPALLFAAIARLLGLEEEMDRPATPRLTREVSDLGASVNRAVYEQTGGLIDLWTGLLLVLGGLGIRKMMAEGVRSSPAGMTLLWWSLTSLVWRKPNAS